MNEQWTAKTIADGILTWHTWPGFEGHQCRKCNCEMNVLGMSYDHRCPDCDPDGKHHSMCSMHHEGRFPFEQPEFGPSMETIRAGGCLATEISESQREFVVGDRVLYQDPWPYRGSERHSAVVVGFDLEFSYPGMRAYDVRFECGATKMCYERQLGLVSRRWQALLAAWFSEMLRQLSVMVLRVTSFGFAA